MNFKDKLKSGYYTTCGNHYPDYQLRDTDRIEYTRLKDLYNKEMINLEAEFKKDMFDNYEVTDNPKVERCYNLAWEHGHSSGLSEVHNYFSDFVELIK